MNEFPLGLYDQLIDRLLNARLEVLREHRLRADIREVDAAEIPDRVGEVIGRWVRDTVAGVDIENRADAAAKLSIAVLETMSSIRAERQLLSPLRRLTAVEPVLSYRRRDEDCAAAYSLEETFA